MRLLVVDTTGIQTYIFGSNRLRENIGASHLVAEATGAWARALLPEPHNVQGGLIDDERQIERDALAAEVVYAGGGNLVALFREPPDATAFTRKLSRRTLRDAPNLRLVIAERDFDWERQSLVDEMSHLFRQLANQKRSWARSAPLLGLSVTAMCQSTGLPAVGMTQRIGDDPGFPASAEILAKIDVATKRGSAASPADVRLRQDLPPPPRYGYPSDFEQLGGSPGEHSYLAVVHADGDGMGQHIADLGAEYPSQHQNRDYLQALRAFSRAIQEAAAAALRATLEKLPIEVETSSAPALPDLHLNVATDRDSGNPLLPFRPLVFGGDDLTFVCDGRLGLSLAAEYLQQFESETAARPDCRGQVSACAGVAIVKTHYPFARAYALAAELCQEAKAYRREKEQTCSCLDWHFAAGGLAGPLKDIRRRDYAKADGRWLTLRPVTLRDNQAPEDRARSWAIVEKGIAAFRGETWVGRRNKLKGLRDALRDDAVENFRTNFRIRLMPDLGLGDDCRKDGWSGSRCAYFEAIELADWHIPLVEAEKNVATAISPTPE